MIIIFLLAALSASTFTIGKSLMAYCGPIFLIGFRLTIAGSIFLGYYAVHTKKFPALRMSDYWFLLKIALFSFYIGFIGEFWALNYMSSAKTAFLSSLSPLVTAILSYFAFDEKITRTKWAGLFLALIGIGITLYFSVPTEGKEFVGISMPELVLLGSIVSFSYGWIIVRKNLKNHTLPAPFFKGIGMLMGGLGALATAYIVEQPSTETIFSWWFPVSNISYFLSLAGLLILIGNIICYILYIYLFKRYTATLVTFGELTIPFFATFYGWLFLNEPIYLHLFVAMGCLLGGMYIFYYEEKRLGYYS